jgi:UDP-N-acetylglucosamine 2-epimerase
MKVMTIVGTRPEIIKLSCVLPVLDQNVEHVLVHTGQNWAPELAANIFFDLKLRAPDAELNCAANTTMGTVGNMLCGIDMELAREKPDAVLILGDTNSCVAAAYAAKRNHIPIFHMEAGNRCFDERVPEEVNRRIVDHISDINMPYTEHARRNLIAEGIKADRIVKTGSPMREVLYHYGEQIVDSDVLERLNLKHKGYIVLSAHREENVDSPRRLDALVATADRLAFAFDMPVIWSVHPRAEKRLGIYQDNLYAKRPPVYRHKPFGFFDYAQLERHAFCVVSDSGTLTEEAAILGFPAVTIRQAHERPEGTEAGVLIMADLDPYKVQSAVKLAVEARNRVVVEIQDYKTEAVSDVVLKTIVSYTDYINRTVWQRS